MYLCLCIATRGRIPPRYRTSERDRNSHFNCPSLTHTLYTQDLQREASALLQPSFLEPYAARCCSLSVLPTDNCRPCDPPKACLETRVISLGYDRQACLLGNSPPPPCSPLCPVCARGCEFESDPCRPGLATIMTCMRVRCLRRRILSSGK